MPSLTLAKSRAAARSLSIAIEPIERRYVRALRSVAASVAAEYMRALQPFIEERARTDAAARSLPSTFDILGVQVRAAVEGTVGPIFDRHARDVLAANARGLRLQGIRLAPDHRVAYAVQERRKANVDLVVNAQRAYAQSVKDIFESPSSVGMRVEDLQAKLLERGNVSESRAELIARDQTLKLNGAVTQIRQENAGVTEYTWSTSLDERVRPEHASLEGQTFAWSAAPDVGHPGEDFQCRCVALPVIPELADLPPAADVEARAAAAAATPLLTIPVPPPPPPAPTFTPAARVQPAGITMTSSFDDDAVRALGARPDGDVAGAAADVFHGRCPDVAGWQKVYDPPPGFGFKFESMSGSRYGFGLAGRIVTPDGKMAGSMNRSFRREAGQLIVHHDYFALSEKYQGQGIGDALTRSALRSYIEMGVSKVEVDAHWTGRYTWAKFGFSWPKEQNEKFREKLSRFLRKKLGAADARIEAFAEAALDGASAVAALEVDGAALGKAFLLDDDYVSSWSGALHLADGDVGFEQAKKRLKL